MTRFARSIAATLLLSLPAARAGEGKPDRPPIYDGKADARAQVNDAADKARKDGRRVLVMFGFNECGWCHRLHALFEADPVIKEILGRSYVLAMVDTGSTNAEALLRECKGALGAEELGKGIGYPFLAVLDGRGAVLTAQRTDPLEVGDHHDPAKVREFLEKWAPVPASGPRLLDAALARASAEDKLVFLHFGTPTCGWCRRLEAFLAREDMAPIFGRDFVDLGLDLVRTEGAGDVLERYNPGGRGGVPWFAFLDARGEAVVTSDGPKGNIGHPAAPAEIEHFVGMMKKVARRIEPGQIETIESALKAEGAKLTQAAPEASK